MKTKKHRYDTLMNESVEDTTNLESLVTPNFQIKYDFKHNIPLGKFIEDYLSVSVAEPQLVQRSYRPWTREIEKNYNDGLFSGLQARREIILVEISEWLSLTEDELRIGSLSSSMSIAKYEIKILEKHLDDGKKFIITDGQHQSNHIISTFSPNSEKTISTSPDVKWTIQGQSDPICPNGKNMKTLDPTFRAYIQRCLNCRVTIAHPAIHSAVGNEFLDKNSGVKVSPYIPAINNSRNGLKDFHQSITANYEGEVQDRIANTFHSSEVDSIRGLIDTFFEGEPGPGYNDEHHGFTILSMMMYIRIFGDNRNGSTKLNNKAKNAKGRLTFSGASGGGKETVMSILKDDTFELKSLDEIQYKDILVGLGNSIDSQPSSSGKKLSIMTTLACMSLPEMFQPDHANNKYKEQIIVHDYTRLFSEFMPWHHSECELTHYEKYGDKEAEELGKPQLSGQLKKDHKNQAIEATTGYWKWSKGWKNRPDLEQRNEHIWDNFLELLWEELIKKGIIGFSETKRRTATKTFDSLSFAQ